MDLLEADPNGLSQLLLGETKEPAAATKPLADMEVDRIRHVVAPLISQPFPHGPACSAKGKEQDGRRDFSAHGIALPAHFQGCESHSSEI
ncbi:MAG: hypothetical protein WDM79_00480 [Terricaulis sp.]